MSERTYYSEEAKQNAQTKIATIMGLCLVLGAMIGTAVAVLFAPQSGESTRDELGHASESAFDTLQDQVNDLRERFERLTS